jgi:hypothetical protein
MHPELTGRISVLSSAAARRLALIRLTCSPASPVGLVDANESTSLTAAAAKARAIKNMGGRMADDDRKLEINLCWASDYLALAIKAAATFADPAGMVLDIDESRPGFIVLKICENKD